MADAWLAACGHQLWFMVARWAIAPDWFLTFGVSKPNVRWHRKPTLNVLQGNDLAVAAALTLLAADDSVRLPVRQVGTAIRRFTVSASVSTRA